MEKKFIEVCSGCGGLGLGFMNAGFVPLLMNEIDKHCCNTLRLNHPGLNINQGSMTELNLSKYDGQVDCLIGGIPCQPFSTAGKKRGLDDIRGQLIYHFHRLVQECNPKFFLIENVKGLLSHENGNTFKTIMTLLETLNYQLHHQIINSRYYEVPQKRERLIIVGVRKDITCAKVFPDHLENQVLLKDVLIDVPDSPGIVYKERKRQIMSLIPQGGNWRSLPKELQLEYLGEYHLTHSPSAGIAKRLNMNDVSMTLTTSPDQRITERCHPIETRPLTVREYARIQTFPDSYQFCGSTRQQYKQIGNAVPVKLAYHLANAMSKIE